MEEASRIQENADKSEIKDVLSIVNYARDAGLWEEWRDYYHPDATLTTSWFSGTRDEFVDAAKKMKIARHPGESQKHTVTNPWVRLSGARAVAEHDLILYQRRFIEGVELDFTTWSRALALLESGAINPDRMTTHHFPYTRAPQAYHLLHDHTDQTLGVLLDWDIDET